MVDGIPVTTVARTLLDLAGMLDQQSLERVVNQAERLNLLDVREVSAAIGLVRGKPGIGRLRDLLSVEAPMTRSELERRFLRLCRAAGVPPPTGNAPIDLGSRTIIVDFLWRDRRLIVETDGAATHLTRKAFEDDRKRDAELAVLGFRTLRYTERRVRAEPDAVGNEIAALVDGGPF